MLTKYIYILYLRKEEALGTRTRGTTRGCCWSILLEA